jgi:hypothetical protein
VRLTAGNVIFLLGAVLEIVGLRCGVDSAAVAWSLIIYGGVLLWTGYLS